MDMIEGTGVQKFRVIFYDEESDTYGLVAYFRTRKEAKKFAESVDGSVLQEWKNSSVKVYERLFLRGSGE